VAEYKAEIRWHSDGQAFTENRYSRAHTWLFDGGIVVPASSSPHLVPIPYSNPAAVDPEEAFVASLSSCHMLWFLSIAAKRGFQVESYVDRATGVMEKDSSGRLAITRVTLHPAATFADAHQPIAEELNAMHHDAHDNCFIANSVKTEVLCQPVQPV
jgi:organic hydroperoxide reductase OsmC/OhrA